ncbi:MAG TPA: glycerophosphodiester phosphodiesterase [Acidimicrobiales bacterium]|nr:glycerophosphodiester phosphodiesterase [Acidimicrobiales bacterium]
MTPVANPWLSRRILNYAHQGGAREAPSSTLLAMRQALEAGATALELDLHATADREVVVCHDATVDRTTNGTGCIADMTLEAVQSLDAAYWWVPGSVVDHHGDPSDYPLRGRAPADPELRILTLREVLEAFPSTYLNVDIKQTAPTVQPYEHLVADLFRGHGREADVIVASFHDAATDAFSAIAPDISTAAGLEGMADFYFAVRDGAEPPPMRHHALQVPPTHEGTTVVDAAFVGAAHEAGLAVHVWTIDEAEEMERLVELGVDGIMTDCPSVLAGVLRSTGSGLLEAGQQR